MLHVLVVFVDIFVARACRFVLVAIWNLVEVTHIAVDIVELVLANMERIVLFG